MCISEGYNVRHSKNGITTHRWFNESFYCRSIIQACHQETESLQKNERGGELQTLEDLAALQDILYKMELILSLVEVLFIDSVPGKDAGRGEVACNIVREKTH